MQHPFNDIADGAIPAMLAREQALYARRNPKSRKLADESKRHWLAGVPMFWMTDWKTPFPLFIAKASGVELVDVDGNAYVDFCLGDTGAMFGHSPKLIADSLRKQAGLGLTTMLPSPDAPVVGRLLSERFGLPYWQITATASDANRSVLRWARAVGCYHGVVDDTFVLLKNGKPCADPPIKN